MHAAILITVLLIPLSTGTGTSCQFSAEKAKQAAKPLTAFSLNLLKKASATIPNENVIISPASVALALALTESGAGGETQGALKRVLFGDQNTDLSSAYQSLQHLLQIDEEETKLTMANGLFYDKAYSFKADYLSTAKQCFGSELDKVDFKNNKEAARGRINQWVAGKTGNRIPELLQQGVIKNETKLILANAIYLQAKWLERFRRIENLGFSQRGLSHDLIMTPFVLDLDKYQYAADTDFHVVRIPYSSQEDPLYFYIILPKEINGIQKVEGQLTEAKFRALSFTRRKVDLKFPKFSIRTQTKLKPILSDLGLGAIFAEDGSADFSRMTTDRLHVSDVIHEAFIKVNENGTEAAAATAVVIGVPMSAIVGPTEGPIPFVADHPFLFAILHEPTESIVFLGKVNYIPEPQV